MISAIVLAAGLARRFGSEKPLALLDGKSLVRHVVDIVTLPEVADVIVVIPPSGGSYEQALAGSRARTVVNDQPALGLSSSLGVGIRAIEHTSQAVLIALADQPTIDRAVVESIVREWRTTHALIVAPTYRGERGHPVLFDCAVFGELLSIEGDRGARELIERDASRVRLVTVDAAMPPDVDTAADLSKLALPPGEA
ncbi:MAG: nucleotidyltransferase family protein [Gemmatimonadaceae bacterium]